MEDLLSLDDPVMDEISSNLTSPLPKRRLPSMHWVRVRYELGDYLKETQADGVTVLMWTYTHFRDAATDMYLNARDKAPSYHKAAGEYFSDMWYGKEKEYGTTGKQQGNRYVMQQKLFTEIQRKNGTEVVYNFRRLSELPYHLLHAQQMDLLKTECLMNYAFLVAKVSALSVRALLDDVQMAIAVEPSDMDLKMLSDTLHLAGPALLADPRQLASQLIGRLQEILNQDKPLSPGDPRKYKHLHTLMRAARKPPTPTLIPSGTCLTAPGGILFDLLSGHSQSITALTLNSSGREVVTTSKDNTMKLWELSTGRVIRTILDVGEEVHYVRIGAGNQIIITSEQNCLRFWSVGSGECLKTIETLDMATITTASEGNLLAAFFHGSNKMKVCNLKDPALPETKDVLIEPAEENQTIHRDNSIICSTNSNGPKVIHAFKSATYASVRNCETGKELCKLQGPPGQQGSIQALACGRDYYICVARHQYMKLHEIYQLELFDIGNGKYVRSVRGCVLDQVTEIFVNKLGSHCLAMCPSEASATSDIAVWNIETEDHKHLAKHAGVTTLGVCSDLKYCLTASKDESTLRIWNLSSKVNDPAPKQKSPEGIEFIIPMRDHRNYVVAKSMNNGPIAVWNIVKGKCAGKAVRFERGLVEASDVMIVHKHKLIILADKGYSSHGGPPVFSTLRIFDMKVKKYVNITKDCFIVPCLQHEYVVLDDEHLMGLSDNRTHFVVWSISKGQIAYRIKPSFREQERGKGGVDRLHSRKSISVIPQISRGNTAKMTPWERRAETDSARQRRHQLEYEEEEQRTEALRKEKDNGIEKYIISEDYSTIVASYYAHHICVFDVASQTHIQTLENQNSMLLLHIAALTANGSHLVHSNYDDETKISYLTLWDCKSGSVRRRLRNEKNVAAIAIADGGSRIAFGKNNQELRIWDPLRNNHLRKIKGYAGLEFRVNSQIHMIENGSKALVYAGDISMWDLDAGSVLTVFTPDIKIQCLTVCMDGKMIVFGLRDTSNVVTLRLLGGDAEEVDGKQEERLYGESSSEEEDSEEEKEGEEEEDY